MGNTVEPDELSALHQILERNGYARQPDFVLRGRLGSSAKSGVTSRLGSGINVLAAFPQSLVHVFGRMRSDTEIKLLSSDQILVREIPYTDVEGVDLTFVEGAGAVLTLSVRGRAGILQRVLAGGDVIVPIRKNDLEAYRPLLDELKQRLPGR